MAIFHRMLTVFAALVGFALSGPAFAKDGISVPWQLGFQSAATPIMRQITDFHDFLNIIITLVALFVLALMIYVVVRFNEKRNPNPSRTSHNTLLEVAWTVIPIFILVVIAIPSFRLLFAQYDFPKADITITATGAQWYWSYEYPDDVIHDWAVPSFGVKLDAVPGRYQKTWFRAEREGMYYGQCSELCGRNHAFMPIAVRVVSQDEYDAWIAEHKSAAIDTEGKVASAQD